MTKEEQDRARRAAGEAAAELVEAGMVVGLGTGDSASHAIRALAARRLPGLRGVATSRRTEALARELGFTLVELDSLPATGDDRPIDLTIDGADEIDPGLRLIKGAGGALLREKLVAHSSRRMVIVADRSKAVTRLGERSRLPVEIVPFGVPQTLRRLFVICPGAELRPGPNGPLFSDGGNRLVDLPITASLGVGHSAEAGAEELHKRLKLLPGVIETGLFLHEADLAFLGAPDGSVTQQKRP
jgi:ribose 5-phosphate isomerase A